MAEIELIASVVGVAGAGLRLALTLREFASEIKHAARQMHDIATSVSLFATTLRQAGKSVQEKGSPRSHGALESLEQITNNCRSVFEEIESMIQVSRTGKHVRMPNGRRTPSLKQKVQWVFKKSRVQYLTGQLESSKLTLMIMLRTFHYRTTMDEALQTRDKIEASKQATKEEVEEAIKASKEEIESLRAEIRNLILDRYWVDQNLEATARDAAPDDSEEPGYNESTATSERAVHGESSKALVLPKPSSLTSLDASLADADTSIDNISQRTVSRSTTAVEYLLDRWTVATDSRGIGNCPEDRLLDSDDESFDEEAYYRPQGSFSESGAHPNPQNQNFRARRSSRIDEDNLVFGSDDESLDKRTPHRFRESVPKSRTRLNPSNQNSATRRPPKDRAPAVPPDGSDSRNVRASTETSHGSALYQFTLPVKPPFSGWTLEPSRSYKLKNKEIIWAIDREEYVQLCLTGSDSFLWGVSNGDSYMKFIGVYFIAAHTWSASEIERPFTMLHYDTFSETVLLKRGLMPCSYWVTSVLDFTGSPLQGQDTRDRWLVLPRCLGIREIRELRQLSLEGDTDVLHFHKGNHMTTAEHVGHLDNLQLLESLGR
ncbi:hypothetical protein MMC18_009010 [Xylographa bjoerkii]|nr:hypothetical protein [Xylographa bjoerkii]MCJ1396121.1 hypothetical protein [Xylographa bjoerkii]